MPDKLIPPSNLSNPSFVLEILIEKANDLNPQGFPIRRKEKMNRTVINLIAAAERSERGYVDVPPGSVNDEIESELAALGYAVSLSDRLWLGGFRIYSPESIQAGNYRPHIPPSIFTCASSQFARVPDARDFDLDTILEERGELPSS